MTGTNANVSVICRNVNWQQFFPCNMNFWQSQAGCFPPVSTIICTLCQAELVSIQTWVDESCHLLLCRKANKRILQLLQLSFTSWNRQGVENISIFLWILHETQKAGAQIPLKEAVQDKLCTWLWWTLDVFVSSVLHACPITYAEGMVTDPFVQAFRFISFDLDIFDPSSPPRGWCRRLPCSSPPTPIVFPPLLTHRMAWCVRVYEQGVGFAYESSARRQINKVHMATHSLLLGLVVDRQPHNHCQRLEYSKQDSNSE